MDALDMFPTPPWATRALCEWISARQATQHKHVWEPACGMGHMSRVLKDYFQSVYSTDIHDYGVNDCTIDFLQSPLAWRRDWVITNPPFNQAAAFAKRGLACADNTALLVRTSFLEGQGRYNDLFSYSPPTDILQFTERVPMHKGRLLKNGSTATAYAWLVWRTNVEQHLGGVSQFHWIPPCRKQLEREEDYA